MRTLKRLIHIGIVAVLLVLALIAGVYVFVSYQAQGDIYSSADEMPYHHVGLVLGTTPRVADGRRNLFFHYRIQAALELYKAGKIDKILVSGDNARESYNEPQYMKEALMEESVPEDDIILDYAGFQTRDSVMRSSAVFGQSDITIVSQPFQLERALLVSSEIGQRADGFAARDVHYGLAPRVYIRELGARIKAVYEHIIRAQPRFLGESIIIP